MFGDSEMKPWRDESWRFSITRAFKCRCNICYSRVTREKHPKEYRVKKWGKCPHFPNCSGELYVDWYRMWKPNKDRGQTCNCDGYHYPHRYGSEYCNNREEWIIEKSLRGKDKPDNLNTPEW